MSTRYEIVAAAIVATLKAEADVTDVYRTIEANRRAYDLVAENPTGVFKMEEMPALFVITDESQAAVTTVQTWEEEYSIPCVVGHIAHGTTKDKARNALNVHDVEELIRSQQAHQTGGGFGVGANVEQVRTETEFIEHNRMYVCVAVTSFVIQKIYPIQM